MPTCINSPETRRSRLLNSLIQFKTYSSKSWLLAFFKSIRLAFQAENLKNFYFRFNTYTQFPDSGSEKCWKCAHSIPHIKLAPNKVIFENFRVEKKHEKIVQIPVFYT
jgi:hypothetical protein